MCYTILYYIILYHIRLDYITLHCIIFVYIYIIYIYYVHHICFYIKGCSTLRVQGQQQHFSKVTRAEVHEAGGFVKETISQRWADIQIRTLQRHWIDRIECIRVYIVSRQKKTAPSTCWDMLPSWQETKCLHLKQLPHSTSPQLRQW